MNESQFGILVTRAAETGVGPDVPRERQALAVRSIASAFASALRGSPNPGYLLDCSEESIKACVHASMLTGIYPGVGSAALAYLVPRKGSLCWSLTHRGYAVLAARDGITINPCPVARGDHLLVEYGEVIEHRMADPSRAPVGLDDLVGVVVNIRSHGHVIRYWVPVSVIQARRAASATKRTDGPWHAWPISMAQGAAIREAVARGAIPLTLEARPALDVDVETIDVEPDATVTVADAPRALPDYGQIDDLTATPTREPVTVPSRPPRRGVPRPADRPAPVPAPPSDDGLGEET